MDQDMLGWLTTGGMGLFGFLADSYIVATVKFFLFVYVSVLLVDIILLLALRGFSRDFRVALYGRGDRPIVIRSKAIKRWEAILSRLTSDNVSQYKVAVLEADTWAEELLDGIGYKGTTMAERLEQVQSGQLETRDILVEAHQVRNRIVHQKDFVFSREEAEACLMEYKKFFDELELF